MFRLFFPPAGLTEADRTLLLLLGAAFFIGNYDMSVLSLALPNMQASFNIAEEDLGQVIAAARLGALPAIFLALLSDRIGRRRLLMVTLLGLSVTTAATGFARTTEEFVAIQFCARGFATAEEIIAVIYILEMLPARHRGWGVGFLAAMGGLGAGAASLLYGLVDVLPGGWRALYLIATVPILYIAWLRRRLPESGMFTRYAAASEPALLWQPFRDIWRHHRREMTATALIAAAFWFQLAATLNFMSKYLQEVRHFEPQQVSLMYIVAGAIAILGNTTAGRISDHLGRRPTLVAMLVLHCAATIVFYNTGGWLLSVAWIATLFGYFAVEVMVNAMSGELFPTACRSTASTLRSISGMFAAVAGLAVEGMLYSGLGSHSAAISIISLSSLLAVPVVVLMLRETSGTELS
ncbi:MAG: MFS transporter [Halioglobus sp.]|nr:MFS transporter [Halioglobus sp.]